LFNDASVAPTPSDPETRSLVAGGGRDRESSALISPSIHSSRRSSFLSEASEPPEMSAEEAEEMINRGSISRQAIKRMFIGERARTSRPTSRSESPSRPYRADVRSPPRSQGYRAIGSERDRTDGEFEIGAESENEDR
jgi:hypothetical protein